MVTVARSAENVSPSISPRRRRRACSRHGRPAFQIDVVDAVADFLVAGEADADRAVRDLRMRDSSGHASMMTATPALSSAPKSVVPSVVMIVLPFRLRSSGLSATRITLLESPGKHDVAAVVIPVHDRLDACGRSSPATYRRGRSRRSPERRAAPCAGIVAMTMPCSSCPAIAQPHSQLPPPAATQPRFAPASWDRNLSLPSLGCRSARIGKKRSSSFSMLMI